MSTATPGSVGALSDGGAVVIVRESSRTAEMMRESLSHDASTVTDTEELDGLTGRLLS